MKRRSDAAMIAELIRVSMVGIALMLFSRTALAEGEQVAPIRNWYTGNGIYCNFDYPSMQAPPGATREELIQTIVDTYNALCQSHRGTGYTATFSAAPCDAPRGVGNSSATVPCDLIAHVVPKPSCVGTCVPYYYNYNNAALTYITCFTASQRTGAVFTMPEETCNCPVNTWLSSGQCIPLKKQILKPDACCVGNPISPGTGAKTQEEVDYEGTSSIPLRFSRTYNSKAPAGKRWRSNFDRTIDFVAFSSTALAILNRADGSYGFAGTTASSSSWTPDPDVTYRMVGSMNYLTVLTPERGEREDFTQNRINSIKAASGSEIRYSFAYSTTSTPYNIAPRPNLLLRVADAFGHALTFTYGADGSMATMTDPAGGLYSYSYDGNGNLISVTYPDGRVRQYVYGELALTGGVSQPSALTGILDEDGVRYASFGYSASGLAVLTEHAGGVQRYETAYSSAPATQDSLLVISGSNYGIRAYVAPTGVTVTDPLGTVRAYGFSSVQGAVKATGASALCVGACSKVPSSQTLDANGNVTQKTDFNGNQTSYVFDLARNLETSRTEAYGTPRARTISTAWHGSFRLPTLITEPNRKTAFTYNSKGDLLTRTVTDTAVSPNVTRTWTYTYDVYSRLLTENGPRTDVSDITTYTYYTCTTGYQCGHLNTVTNALGHVTTYNTYDAHGQPIQITDKNGVVTTLGYDLRQRLIARCMNGVLPACVGGELTTVEYWPTGLLKKVTLPDGSFSSYGYDAAHRLIQVADNGGNYVDYTLDAIGNRTGEAVYDPGNTLRRTHTRVYNSLSQLYQDVNAISTGGATTSYSYDSNGNQTAVNAPLSRFTNNVYDELNRLKQVTDPEFGDTYFAYDANDNLTSVTDPRGLVTSYTNNGFGDVKTTTSPDTGLTTNTYDTGGNLKTTTDARNAVATYNYDVLDRVTSVAYSKSGVTDQTIAYTYDAGTNGKGQLTGASDADHSMSWGYDASGRVTSKTVAVGTVSLGVGYGYTNGQLATLTLPSGNVVSYAYNSDGQVSSVQVGSTPLLSAATYEPFGPVSGWTWGNGVTHTRSYDEDGAIAAIGTSDTNGINQGYTYDAGSRITSIFDAATNPNSWTFDYDLQDRITSATGSSQVQGWTYDANGNRLSETGTRARASTISATSNRLETLTGFLNRSYSYDAAGNATSYEDIVLTYNNRGRLAANQKASYTRYYTYNALGQLAKATGGSGGTVHYVHDEAGHLLGEYDAAGGLIQETIWLGDTPVATIRPSGGGIEVFHVHADHLDTPVRITQASDNALRWQWSRDPFGTMPADEDPSGLGQFVYNLRFPGQMFDGQVGLHQNYFRDYSPAVGRYLQSDPIGLEGGINTYSYVNGNPLSKIDPDGKIGFLVIPGICAAGGCEAIAVALGLSATLATPKAQKALRDAVAAESTPMQCPDDDECNRLNQQVQTAKARTAALGSCRRGMSRWQLTERYQAWLTLASARSRRDQKCWGGGDEGHQQAHAAAWKNVGDCGGMLQ